MDSLKTAIIEIVENVFDFNVSLIKLEYMIKAIKMSNFGNFSPIMCQCKVI